MDKTKERKVLLADGPKMIVEFNPKARERFSDRVCETCNGPILLHWLIPSDNIERRTSYFCDPEGKQISTGLKI